MVRRVAAFMVVWFILGIPVGDRRLPAEGNPPRDWLLTKKDRDMDLEALEKKEKKLEAREKKLKAREAELEAREEALDKAEKAFKKKEGELKIDKSKHRRGQRPGAGGRGSVGTPSGFGPKSIPPGDGRVPEVKTPPGAPTPGNPNPATGPAGS